MDATEWPDIIRNMDFSIVLDGLANGFAALVIIAIGVFISRRINSALRKYLGRVKGFDDTLIPLAASVVRYTILIVTLVAALGSFGIQTTSIIAVLGAAGLAIGLALQGTLSNVAAGIMLLLLRPFGVGDWIEANGISGTVREIGLFSTQIDTFENIYISVPNSSIWSSIIINHSRHDVRRMDIDIGISYESDLDIAEKALLSLTDDERVKKDPAPVFLVVAYGDNAITVRLRLFAEYKDYFQLNWDLNRRLKTALESRNIEIPYPQLVISRKSDDGSQS